MEASLCLFFSSFLQRMEAFLCLISPSFSQRMEVSLCLIALLRCYIPGGICPGGISQVVYARVVYARVWDWCTCPGVGLVYTPGCGTGGIYPGGICPGGYGGYHASLYHASLYHPGYTTIPPCVHDVSAAVCAPSAVRAEEALGSNLRIIRGKRPPCASRTSRV